MHGSITKVFMKTYNLLKLAFRPLIFTFKITSFSKAIHLLSSPISSQLQSLLFILFCKSSIMLILLSILVNWCCFLRVTSSPCYLRLAKLTTRFVGRKQWVISHFNVFFIFDFNISHKSLSIALWLTLYLVWNF